MDGKNKIFIIVAIAVSVLSLVIAGSTLFVMKSLSNNQPPQSTQAAAEKEKVELTEVAMGDAIMTNIAMESNDIQHFAKIQISVGIDASDKKAYEALAAEIAAKAASIRSEVIDTIGEQTFSMLSNTATGKEKLSDEIIARLNKLLDTDMIRAVYYQEYFVQ